MMCHLLPKGPVHRQVPDILESREIYVQMFRVSYRECKLNHVSYSIFASAVNPNHAFGWPCSMHDMH